MEKSKDLNARLTFVIPSNDLKDKVRRLQRTTAKLWCYEIEGAVFG